MSKLIPFFISIPHSGEKVPDFCDWLHGLPEEILMCDVDRYVDQLYAPAIKSLQIPSIKTEWHRYAADMNRVPEDIDEGSVEGHPNKIGSFNRGFHWQITTYKHQLMKKPMPKVLHDRLIELIYNPFHADIRKQFQTFKDQGFQKVYQLDCHSMPSLGTGEHRDPGEKRADIVVSDCKQQSSEKKFVDLAIAAYVKAGFKVGYNWPYLGGRVSEQYGKPNLGQNTVQVEMNRALYMDEKTKKLLPRHLEIQKKVEMALHYIQDELKAWG